MKMGIMSNKKRAVITTVILSLLVGTLINVDSWYGMLQDGCSKKDIDVVKEDVVNTDKVVYDAEFVDYDNDDYAVYDEDYNIIEDESSIEKMINIGNLGLDNQGMTLKCETTRENVEVQEVASKTKMKKEIVASAGDIKLLACIINAEAKGEPYAGKLGVANVVLNRFRNKKFPNTIKKVIYQKHQFGPVKNGALNRELKNYSKGVYKKNKAAKASLKAAKEALKGRYIINKYNFNSKYYFNGKKASRARKNNIIIKNHRFW